MSASKLIAGIGLVVAASAGAVLWYNAQIADAIDRGKGLERAIWMKKDAERTAAEKDALLAHQETIRLLQKANDARNVKVANDAEQKIAQLKKAAQGNDAALLVAGGLRVPKSICDSLGSGAQATGDRDHDAYLASTVQLPASIERFLKSEADRADEIVEVARECQSWARVHGFYGEPTQ